MNTCALVAASGFNRDEFVALFGAGVFDFVIAVDGGYAHLRDAGLRGEGGCEAGVGSAGLRDVGASGASLQGTGCVVDLAVGDFDSLGYVPTNCPVETHPSHKDKSDLELALDQAIARGSECLVVFGALGGRLDHTLANIQLLARVAESGVRVVVVGTDCALAYVVGPGVLQLPAGQQGTVSVFSLSPVSHGVSEQGLVYELDCADVCNRTTLGLSNELDRTTDVPASISLEDGTLAVFFPLACAHTVIMDVRSAVLGNPENDKERS